MRVIRSGQTALAILAAATIFAAGCKTDTTSTTEPTVTPITANLFPLVAGHSYEYTGYLVDTNSVSTPAPGIPAGAYHASWLLIDAGDGTWLLLDSTHVASTTSVRFFRVKKDSSTGDIAFLQTLGPFYRAIQASYTDTAIWLYLARPSRGMNSIWTAFDTTVHGTVNGVSSDVHLQIFGIIEARETITDSTDAHTAYNTYRIRTYRTITVGPISVTTTTAKLWLAADVGPVQVDIAGDPENYGHFRVMQDKNF